MDPAPQAIERPGHQRFRNSHLPLDPKSKRRGKTKKGQLPKGTGPPETRLKKSLKRS